MSTFTAIFIIIFLFYSALLSATPLNHHRRQGSTVRLESTPWILSNINVIDATEAPGNSTVKSSISFKLQDTNKGLEMETTCSYTAAQGGLSASTPDTFYRRCSNTDVSFRYDGTSVYIARSYLPNPR
jgi:hypothetical protein